MNARHKDLFDNVENTAGFGIALKKGVIFAEFDKHAMHYRDTRRAEALKRMREEREREEAAEKNKK